MHITTVLLLSHIKAWPLVWVWDLLRTSEARTQGSQMWTHVSHETNDLPQQMQKFSHTERAVISEEGIMMYLHWRHSGHHLSWHWLFYCTRNLVQRRVIELVNLTYRGLSKSTVDDVLTDGNALNCSSTFHQDSMAVTELSIRGCCHS